MATKKITKNELAEAIIAVNPSLTKKAAKEVVDTIFDTIVKNVKKKNEVDIFGFGKFSLKSRKARKGINPLTKEKIKIAATKVPAFKASKSFKDSVK